MAASRSVTGHAPRTSSSGLTSENVKFIRLWFTDILGQLKSFAITRDEVGGRPRRTAWASTDPRSPASTRIEESDMIAMPDPDTFRSCRTGPREPHGRRGMFCDIRVPGGEPYEGDPR